ncbi:MAG: Holliday junction branch migration DNA helicase RuvB [Candidatus Algichlamydia australiensis]|nr:Holliday junction branch migration DNA helicase RuvB [Chlamydiales bacterium]
MNLPKPVVKPDPNFENQIRPAVLHDFLGQSHIHKRLQVLIGAAKQREESLAHTLFYGPPGLGKTTLAKICANEMGTNFVSTSGPAIDKAGDLAGILTSLEEGDVLFIDEIHRLSTAIEEYLYPAIEDYKLDLMLDSGPNARSVQLTLAPFTLIGATTRLGLLSSPMRSRFEHAIRLDFYEEATLTQIILRSAKVLNCSLDPLSAKEISLRSRGTPRIANNLLRWVRDYAQIHNDAKIDIHLAKTALEMIKVDPLGLGEMDKKILQLILDHHNGGPVGVKTLAAALGEEPSTIEEVYEPFLIMQGLLKRTPRGRETTSLAKKHIEGTC